MDKFDFDRPTDRRNTFSYKWDVLDGELPMWVADMDFETAPCVKDALLKRAEHGVFGYALTPDEFFLAFSDFFAERHGYRHSPEDMIFSTGVVASVSSAVRKLTTPAESVLLLTPVYNIFYNSILNNGRRPKECELVYENGCYSVDFLALEKALSDPQCTLFILCNPHNPVGRIWTREELARMGELAEKYGVTVISDEIHCSITDPGRESYVPFASVNETCRDISVTLLSATKAFNIAGLQCSIAVAANPVLRHKMWRALNTDECAEPNVFAVPAAVAALRCGGEWLDSLLSYLFENRRLAEAAVSRIDGLVPVSADATYLLWIDARAVSESSEALCDFLREKTGLILCPGSEYGLGGEGFLRLNLATNRARLVDGLARLERGIGLFLDEKTT